MPPRRISDTTRSDVQRPAETARVLTRSTLLPERDDRDVTTVRRHLTRDVDRVGRVPAGQRVGEPDDGCLGPVEDLGEHRLEVRVGRIIGPQREDSAVMQMPDELSQSRRRVERAVARCRTCRGVWSISRRTAWKRRPGASGSKPTLLSAMASTIRSTAPSLRQSPCSPTPSRRRILTWCCIPMWIAGGSDKVRLCIAAKCAQLYQLHIGARRVRPQVAGAGRPFAAMSAPITTPSCDRPTSRR